MATIRLTDRTGVARDIDAVEGWRLMEIIRDHGYPIAAECGGACACATCHVHIAPDWLERLAPPHSDEEDMLDTVEDLRTTSRLACQIIWSDSLDGLELSLPAAPEPGRAPERFPERVLENLTP